MPRILGDCPAGETAREQASEPTRRALPARVQAMPEACRALDARTNADSGVFSSSGFSNSPPRDATAEYGQQNAWSRAWTLLPPCTSMTARYLRRPSPGCKPSRTGPRTRRIAIPKPRTPKIANLSVEQCRELTAQEAPRCSDPPIQGALRRQKRAGKRMPQCRNLPVGEASRCSSVTACRPRARSTTISAHRTRAVRRPAPSRLRRTRPHQRPSKHTLNARTAHPSPLRSLKHLAQPVLHPRGRLIQLRTRRTTQALPHPSTAPMTAPASTSVGK